jgi:hypothetical protein
MEEGSSAVCIDGRLTAPEGARRKAKGERIKEKGE